MDSEYAVKISLTRHDHDSPEAPYYWSLVHCDKAWHQIAFGWEESPQKCFSAAMKWYSELMAAVPEA